MPCSLARQGDNPAINKEYGEKKIKTEEFGKVRVYIYIAPPVRVETPV